MSTETPVLQTRLDGDEGDNGTEHIELHTVRAGRVQIRVGVRPMYHLQTSQVRRGGWCLHMCQLSVCHILRSGWDNITVRLYDLPPKHRLSGEPLRMLARLDGGKQLELHYV